MVNVSKLTGTNYLMWNRQIHALLNGYNLAGHLDGSNPAPSPTIITGNSPVTNPLLTHWQRQDQLIFSGLLGAISVNIQPLLSRTTTAAEIWETLSNTYAKPSRGHIRNLKHQLQEWKKGTKTIDEYVQGCITKFDQLAILGKVIELEEQVEKVLEGLPEEYKPVVDQIEGRDEPPSLADIHERLRNHEAKLLTTAAAPSLGFPASANVVSQKPHPPRFFATKSHKHHQRHTHQWQSQPNSNHNKRFDKTSRPYLGKCQLCGVTGHTARTCSLHHPPPASSSSHVPNQFRPWQPKANHASASHHNGGDWILDSGATHHITSDLHNLSLHQPYNGGDEVLIGDGSGLKITHTGSSTLPSTSRSLSLNHVLCVPDIHKNLISVYRLCNTNQVSVEFFPASFQVKDLSTGAPLLQGVAKDELYEWPVSPSIANSFLAFQTPKTSLSSWHSRLGHPSLSILQSLISKFSLPISTYSNKTLSCTPCLINKSHKLPFSNSSITSDRPLQYIFTDVWSSPITSTDNYKYYLILVDHYTRYTWFYPLKAKSQVRDTFIAYKALVENHFHARITTLYSDNGGEFIALRSYLSAEGISHLTTPPHTPEHNGISERKHRHIVETGMTLLSHASLPKSYCPYAFATAVFLINRLPTPVLSLESPFQKLFQRPPNYSRLRVFGCQCFPWLRPYNKHKLEDKSKSCVFIGYSTTQSAYLCLDVETRRVFTSRHVQFLEDNFPFNSHSSSTFTNPEPDHDQTQMVLPVGQPAPPPVVVTQSPPPSSDPHPPSPPQPRRSGTNSHRLSSFPSDLSETAPIHSSPIPPSNIPTNPPLQPNNSGPFLTNSNTQHSGPLIPPLHQEPSSSSQPPTTTHPNSTTDPPPDPIPDNNPPPPQNQHSMKTRSKNNITKATKKLNLSSIVPVEPYPIPNTAKQALKDPNWIPALTDEINAQIQNGSWDLVPPSPTQNVVGCRWIFTIKRLPNGLIDRYKARLVSKVFHQQLGVD